MQLFTETRFTGASSDYGQVQRDTLKYPRAFGDDNWVQLYETAKAAVTEANAPAFYSATGWVQFAIKATGTYGAFTPTFLYYSRVEENGPPISTDVYVIPGTTPWAPGATTADECSGAIWLGQGWHKLRLSAISLTTVTSIDVYARDVSY